MARVSGNGGGAAQSTLDRLGAIADPRHKSYPATLRHVTNRVGIFNQKSGGNTRSGWRCWQSSYVPVSAIKIGIWNGYTNSALSGVETGCGGPLTLALSIEYPRGTFTRLTWGGAATGTIADNAVGFSDLIALPVTVPAFTWFRIAGDFQYLSGGTVPSCGWSTVCDRAMGDEYQVGTTADYTMQTSGLTTASGATAVFPQLVLAQSTRPAWGVIGDSIAAGVNDIVFDASGGRGLFGRALAELGPHLNYGVPGDRAAWYKANSATRRGLLAAGGATAAMLQLGINDLVNGGTAAGVLADRASIRALVPNMSICDTTLLPTTASSDSFKTAANQTVAGSSPARVTLNTALRAGMVSQGLIDLASHVETSTAFEHGPVPDGGAWMPRYMTGSDGTHPNPVALMALKPLVQGALSILH